MADFFCDALNWFCPDHGEMVTRNTPEISAGSLALACLLIGGALLIADEWRRKSR